MIHRFEYQTRTLNNSTYMENSGFNLALKSSNLQHVMSWIFGDWYNITWRQEGSHKSWYWWTIIPPYHLQHAAPTVDTLASILLVFALLTEQLFHWFCNFRAAYVTLVLRSTTKINWLISHHHILETHMAILKECPMFKQTHIHCSLVNSLFLTYSCWIPISDGEIMLNPLFFMVKFGVSSPYSSWLNSCWNHSSNHCKVCCAVDPAPICRVIKAPPCRCAQSCSEWDNRRWPKYRYID